MDFEEIKKMLDAHIKEHNLSIHPDLDGFTPMQIDQMIEFPFSENCPIQLRKLTNEVCEQIPLFNLVKHLMAIIANAGELKLTKTGALPVKVVMDLYGKGYYKDYYIDCGVVKFRREDDSRSITVTKNILDIAGITKKRNGKLSITKKGEKLNQDHQQLFKAIFEAYTTKFDWGFFDGYESPNIGRFGFAFSLILLLKYGSEKQLSTFYAKKYIDVIPTLIHENSVRYGTATDMAYNCYIYRTIEQFFDLFGLVVIGRSNRILDDAVNISKTSLVDALFYQK